MSIAHAEEFLGLANNAALIAYVDGLAASYFGATYTVGTTPLGSSWYVSPGEDGLRHIVVGLQDDGLGHLIALSGSDFDVSNLVDPADDGGYVSEDNLSPEFVPPYTLVNRAPVATDPLNWKVLDPGKTYSGRISISKDAIAITVEYVSGALPCQGVVYLGIVQGSQRSLYSQARAKVDSVAVAGPNRLITLDRDITNALKDTGHTSVGYPNYIDDPAQQYMFFQSVVTPPDTAGFAMTERAQIVPTTLTTTAGKTEFEVAITGVKLFRPAGRYDLSQGVGDIVSVASEPTVILCASNTNSSVNIPAASMRVTWDIMGGQRSSLLCYGTNPKTKYSSSFSPSVSSGRYMWYPIYVMLPSAETGLVVQPNVEGRGNIGTLCQLIMVSYPSNVTVGSGSKFKVNSDTNKVYKILAKQTNGIKPFAPFDASSNTVFAVGPGF